MTEVTSIDRILAAKTKIKLLAWIGLMSRMEATLSTIEISLLEKCLEDEKCPQEVKDEALTHIPKIHTIMNEGLNIVIKKLDTDDCVKCGKCNHINEIFHMLLNDVDIHTIIPKVEKQFGDISHGHASHAMLGEDEENPLNSIRAKVENLLGAIEAPTDLAGSTGPRSIDPIGSLLEILLGPPVDKDKLI